MKTKKKKKNRRSNTKHAALHPSVNLKTRSDLIDYDYLDKLSDKEKDWLNKFTEEYVHDHLNRKNLKKNLHNTQKLKKDCDDRNNSRNRDILTIIKASGALKDIELVKDRDTNNLNPEQQMIFNEMIEERSKRRKKRS